MTFKTLYTKALNLILMVLFTGISTVKSQSVFEALNYRLNIDATSVFSNGIIGKANVTVKKHYSINKLTFDLLGFTIDSVLVDNQSAAYIKSLNELEITLPSSTNDTCQVEIYYRGTPQKDATWGGFYTIGSYAFNMGVGFSSLPHNFGRAWFPCFDNFTDRAFYEFTVTTLPTYTAVCNGLLTGDSLLTTGNHIWHWKLTQNIPTYLAGIAIGKYSFVHDSISTQNRTIPVLLAAEAKDSTNLKASFAKLGNAVTCFEEKFGPYLFDKVGYVSVPFNAGAMEHATSIAYPSYAIDGTAAYETLMAHELSHHWWGDLATCETAGDMWLNEGWASYCEAVFLECLYGKSVMIDDLKDKLHDVLFNAPKNDKGYRAVANMNDTFTYGTHVYKKGALMVHLLRNVMGDSSFFAACRSYLNKHQFKSTNTNALRDEFQQFTSADLTLFFEQYINTKGHYDVVVTQSNFNPNTKLLTLNFGELRRYKTASTPNTTVSFKIHYTDGSYENLNTTLTNGVGSFEKTLSNNQQYDYAEFDEELKYALAYTSENVIATKKGLVNSNNTLMSCNVQSIADTVKFNVQHHWVSPTQGGLREKGIRISTERYWSIRGVLPQTFSSWAFFSYDGTKVNFLDEELFNYTNTEDSLVFLYRVNENENWQVLGVNEVTYQPGGNPKDKMGRFWLTKLLAGDYALGVRDQSVVGLKETSTLDGKVWPNPTNDELNISIVNQTFNDGQIKIIDNQGRELMSSTLHQNSSQIKLNVKHLTKGAYHVIVTLPSGKFTSVFIKQ